MTDHSSTRRLRYDLHHRNEDLDEKECWRLLEAKEVGRVAFMSDDRVQVFPVNYVAHGGAIYFRTLADGAIGRVVRNQPASFQIDEFDDFLKAGWSVLVTGRGQMVDDVGLLAELWGAKNPEPWADGLRTLFIRVVPEQVTGRRVHPG